MKKTGFLHDDRYLLHETSDYHPERPERLRAIHKGIEDGGFIPMLTRIKASRSRQRWIETVHNIRYIQRFEETCLYGMKEFDYPDNQMCAATYDIAMLAVGGILDTAKLVMEGKIDNAFCSVRPPGHHAETDKAMGFCYFNNVAITAKYLQSEWEIKRVGIIDFDVHHGNGTQHIFEHDPTVFYYSIHEHPSFAFPGTGRDFETGTGSGEGFTLNSPVLPGQGDPEYKSLMERELFPAFDTFQPEVILVSVGFDAHVDDDMSGIMLSTEGYSWIMERIVEMADKYADGRLISILEGGYCLERLPELAKNHVKILLGK
ncbi:histone deacetylase family protein [Desulfonema magnum]|uniref:Histone deacetylase domain-containing protein n=1 Tax=Desulfonema magnum TaxID=45655 RepID=A0A975BNL7_9BACT|nr:histone deacetylase [Desulfonema magnum]QTA88503.1 Histone deacetylase domain-containing protein [Desulfonema magnum]